MFLGVTVKDRYIKILANLVLIVILIAPILIYIYQFGIGVWSEHSSWAEMGSAFGGIYSPIIAFLAFSVLMYQVKSQRSLDEHHYDQTYIQDNKKDFDFYLSELDRQLDVPINDSLTVRDVLHSATDNYDKQGLLDGDVQERLMLISNQHPKLISIWGAMNPLLVGLSVHDRFPYKHNFKGCLLKASSILSLRTCTALDKMQYSTSSGKYPSKMYFWEAET